MNSTLSADAAPSLTRRFSTFLHALAFVLGFSLIFIIGWGGAATVFGQLFAQYKYGIGKLGGVVVIAFGLANLGVLKIPEMYYDTRPEWTPTKRYGLMSSGLMGVFFAAGWSPCIGTTLGAILALGLPFLAIGFGLDRAFELVRRLRKYMRGIQLVRTGAWAFPSLI